MSPSTNIALKRRMTKEVTGTTETAKPGFTYITNNGALVSISLPASSKIGDRITVIGKGAGGWKIVQVAGQQIRHISSDTTAGAAGSLASDNVSDSVTIECTTEPGVFTVTAYKGTLTVA